MGFFLYFSFVCVYVVGGGVGKGCFFVCFFLFVVVFFPIQNMDLFLDMWCYVCLSQCLPIPRLAPVSSD